MTSNEELAWMAGILDGEGCIYLARTERKDRPSICIKQCISVCNCNVNILTPFKNKWGGIIYTYVETRKGYSDHSMWHCATSAVETLLINILPYLVGKKEQALLLLEFLNHKKQVKRYKGSIEGSTRGGSLPLSEEEKLYRIDIFNKMRLLNAKGRFKLNQDNMSNLA